MCGMGFYRSSNYIPTPKGVQELIEQGYKYILLKRFEDYDVFTMLKLKNRRNDGNFLLETTNNRFLVMSKWDFAEHSWTNNKDGWRRTLFGSIKFVEDGIQKHEEI